MPTIMIRGRTGDERRVTAPTGLSVMEVIRDNGFDELLALCGGSCSCATCHVYVAEEDFGRLPPPGVDEQELLDSSEHRTALSRLSCQLRTDDVADGLRVTIAPED